MRYLLDRLFQFPSNGKGFPNSADGNDPLGGSHVSIPFKRERLSEQVSQFFERRKDHHQFQFPSNGKGFPNLNIPDVLVALVKVSIPFKRERLSERICRELDKLNRF